MTRNQADKTADMVSKLTGMTYKARDVVSNGRFVTATAELFRLLEQEFQLYGIPYNGPKLLGALMAFDPCTPSKEPEVQTEFCRLTAVVVTQTLVGLRRETGLFPADVEGAVKDLLSNNGADREV